MLACNSSSTRHLNLFYDPLAHIAVSRGIPFIASQGTHISNFAQYGRYWYPSPRTTIVYRIWRCKKWTQRALQIMALPVHPPPLGIQCCMPPYGRRYYTSRDMHGGSTYHPPLSHPMLNLQMYRQVPCRQFWIALGAAYPLMESLPLC